MLGGPLMCDSRYDTGLIGTLLSLLIVWVVATRLFQGKENADVKSLYTVLLSPVPIAFVLVMTKIYIFDNTYIGDFAVMFLAALWITIPIAIIVRIVTSITRRKK